MVLGLGVTGCSVIRWWRAQGVPFKAADTRPGMAQDSEVLAAIGADTDVYFGEINPQILDTVSELVVSPGIALDDPFVQLARDRGIRIIGDIDIFMALAKAPVIGITGSNGKTTVTALLGTMLRQCGKQVAVGGNVGTPALDLLDDSVELYVLELSSFQLERAQDLGLSVATVLNVSADHLDRHGSMPRYHLAKHRIFQGAKSVVVNRADPLTIPLLEHAVDVLIWRPDEPDLNEFGTRIIDDVRWICRGFEPLLPVSRLLLPGDHNLNNALAALACGVAAGADVQALVQGLTIFEGLPHRCETVSSAKACVGLTTVKAPIPERPPRPWRAWVARITLSLLRAGWAKIRTSACSFLRFVNTASVFSPWAKRLENLNWRWVIPCLVSA